MIKDTIKTITYTLSTWLWYFIGMQPIINLIVVTYWLFNLNDRDRSLKNHPRLTTAIYIFAVLTLMGVLFFGIEAMLFIIPYSWKFFDAETENWVFPRAVIAGNIAFFGSFVLAQIFATYEELTRKTEQLEEKEYQNEIIIKELRDKVAMLDTGDDWEEVDVNEDV